MEAGVRIAVVGLGNVLLGDDGFGPDVVQVLLAGWDFAQDVAVHDLGTPGLDLAPWVHDLDALVLVDTVRADAAPGTLRLYRREELLRHPPGPRVSPHDPGLHEALMAGELAGSGPREVLLVGVVPETSELGPGLSASVRPAVAPACQAVLDELDRLGRPAARRARPARPDLWWEAPVAAPPAAR
jgi:hydrogenase maturation protease